jgi:hypothetical protein
MRTLAHIALLAAKIAQNIAALAPIMPNVKKTHHNDDLSQT